MCSWSGVKSTQRSIFACPSTDFPLQNKLGPSRKLTLDQEFLMVMMRLRLDLLIKDLAFRFSVSDSRVTQTLIAWIKLLSKQLSCLIIWPKGSNISHVAVLKGYIPIHVVSSIARRYL